MDYFNARYFGAALGRFTSPDPGNAGTHITDPQTWNAYAYVRNNPLAITDPSGLDPYFGCHTDSNGGGLLCGSSYVGNCVAEGDEGCIAPPPSYDASQHYPSPAESPTSIAGGPGVATGSMLGYQSPELTEGLNAYLTELRDAWGWVAGDNPADILAHSQDHQDSQSCSARVAQGIQQSTGFAATNLQYAGSIGGHPNYTFDVVNPAEFQAVLSKNPPWPLPFGLDKGYRYGVLSSTHIENTPTGGFIGHIDLFSGHSALAPLHWIGDVGIGHIPGVNLDSGCQSHS
jgi:hypothetical protein